MAEETRRSQPKKNRHTGTKVTVAAAVIAALLAGGHFGLGIGRGDGDGLLPGQEAPTQPTAAAETPAAETAAPDDGALSIVVRESDILYKGQAVTLSELEAALLSDYAEGGQVLLTDDHAIKAAYDEVCALLETLSIPFTAE